MRAWICVALAVAADAAHQHTHGNPIRKVVVMLQDMQKSVEESTKKEVELFDKFACYCKETGASLSNSIEEGKARSADIASTIEANSAQVTQLNQDIVGHKEDRTQAEKEVKETTALRNREAAAFAEESAEMKTDIQSLEAAMAALKQGVAPASLLQSNVGGVLRAIAGRSGAITDADRSVLTSFLDAGDGGVEPSTDQIIGIVGQMAEEMAEDLKNAVASEEEAKAGFNSLMRAKSKEIKAATKAVESKMSRSGNLAVETAQAKDDYEGTEASLAKDVDMETSLKKTCAEKTKLHEEREKSQAEEVSAISEAIKLLNDDDALELFKKTLPGPASFLQTTMHSTARAHSASRFFRDQMARDSSNSANYRMMLLSMQQAARAEKGGHSAKAGGGFDKVIEMVDRMVALLNNEQDTDDKTKDVCIADLDKEDDDKKSLQSSIAEAQGNIAKHNDQIAEVSEEIEALKAGIGNLDKSVAAATEQRKQEHDEHLSQAAANQAAVKLLHMAKNKMNKFYNPEEYRKPEPTPEPEGNKYMDASFAQGSAGDAAEGSADGIIFVQVKAHQDLDDFLEHKGPVAGSAAGGVLAMMDQIAHGVELDMKEAETEEVDAQKDYEQAMAEATAKRAADSKLIVTKDGERAEMTAILEDLKGKKALKESQLAATMEKISDLHSSCDQLIANFDARKKARAAEIEGLKNSKAVLSGAKFGSFLQRHQQ